MLQLICYRKLPFEFKDAKLVFNITLTDSVTVPGFGSVKPVIKMEYDLTKEAKGMFISLGDSYKVKYVITENSVMALFFVQF